MLVRAKHTWNAFDQMLIVILPLLLPFTLTVLIIAIVSCPRCLGRSRRGNISWNFPLFALSLVNASWCLWCLRAAYRADRRAERPDIFVIRGEELEARQQVLRGIKIRPLWWTLYRIQKGENSRVAGNPMSVHRCSRENKGKIRDLVEVVGILVGGADVRGAMTVLQGRLWAAGYISTTEAAEERV